VPLDGSAGVEHGAQARCPCEHLRSDHGCTPASDEKINVGKTLPHARGSELRNVLRGVDAHQLAQAPEQRRVKEVREGLVAHHDEAPRPHRTTR